MKKKKTFTIIACLLVFVAIFTLGWFFIRNRSIDKARNAANTSGDTSLEKSDPLYMVYTEEDFLEERAYWDEQYKAAPSEIAGMSVYDKEQMGLSSSREDTDLDGLTDDEEMNVYGSDPLKASTSGDFYSDGYKVENNMDLFTYYERDLSELNYPNNACREITIIPNKLEDTWRSDTQYRDYEISLEDLSEKIGVTVYQYFYVNSNGADFNINLENALFRNDVTADDVTILASGDLIYANFPEFGLQDVNYELNGDIATVTDVETYLYDANFRDYPCFYYLIVNKHEAESRNTFLGSLSDELDEITEQFTEDNDDEVYAIMTASALGTLIGDHPTFQIYFHDTGDTARNEQILSEIQTEGRDQFGFSNRTLYFDVVECTASEIKRRLSIYRTIIPMCEIKLTSDQTQFEEMDTTFFNGIFAYFDYSNFEARDKVIEQNRIAELNAPHKVASGFDFNTETFVFENFGNERSRNGHCAAISTLTAKLHNGYDVPVMGSYTNNSYLIQRDIDFQGTVTWNLGEDPENQTLMDPGLSDYKSADFVGADHMVKAVTNGEKEFVNYMDCLLAEYNLNVKRYCDTIPRGDLLEYNTVEHMIGQLDQGKIIAVGFVRTNSAHQGDGHVVNVYDYRRLNDGKDTVEFMVYDSNTPGDPQVLTVWKEVQKNADELKDNLPATEKMNFKYLVYSTDYDGYRFIVTDADMYFVSQVSTRITYTTNSFTGETHLKTYGPWDFAKKNEEIRKERSGN